MNGKCLECNGPIVKAHHYSGPYTAALFNRFCSGGCLMRWLAVYVASELRDTETKKEVERDG